MTVALSIVSGASLEKQIHATLELLPAGSPCVVAAADARLARAEGGPARLFAESLRMTGKPVRLLAPPASLPAAWVQSRSTKWFAVDVSARSRRLDHVWLPETLAGDRPVILFNQLDLTAEDRPDIALTVWSRFAHPRQRTGAAAFRERDGIGVEIALAVAPALIVLVTEDTVGPAIVATTDQIAAELAGLALLEHARTQPIDAAGPWEDPIVQRATELDLGVRVPARIRANVVWLGAPGQAASAFGQRTATWLRRIGVEPPSGA